MKIIKKYKLKKKTTRIFFSILQNNPFLRGFIRKMRIITPRKPNSARRPCCRVYLQNFFRCLTNIPGSGHNLRKYSKVLIKKNGSRDLPNVNFTCVRGVYDFLGLQKKTSRRSIYACKFLGFKKIKRKYRKKIKKKKK